MDATVHHGGRFQADFGLIVPVLGLIVPNPVHPPPFRKTLDSCMLFLLFC